MKKRYLEDLFSTLEENLDWYLDFFQKVIEAQRVLGQREEKKEISEMIILRLCATWEYYTEKILICCFSMNTKKYADFYGIRLRKSINIGIAERLLLGTNYKDFKSVGDLRGFAKKYLEDKYNPFTNIVRSHRVEIDYLFILRNYLTHYSSFAKKQVAKYYNDVLKVRRWHEPGYFLIGHDGKLMIKFIHAMKSSVIGMRSIL